MTCTAEEQALFQQTRGASIVCFTRGDSIGLTLVAESAFISLLAVLAVFTYICRKGGLVHCATTVYMLSLFTFDMIMALAKVLYVKWIHEAKVYTGGYCTAQGILQQLGDTGSALTTLAIAVHTFVTVLWNHQHSKLWVAYVVVGLTWIFIAVFIAMSVTIHTRDSEFYMTPVGYWCWIGTRFKDEQYAGQYVWVWITMFVSFLTYTTLFFWARGDIRTNGPYLWNLQRQKRPAAANGIILSAVTWGSIDLIAYPIVFAVTTLPLSIIRWSSGFGSNRHKLATATFLVEFIYSLSGALNVLLFLSTRYMLFLPRRRLGMAPGHVALGGRVRENNINWTLLPSGREAGPGPSSTVSQTAQPEMNGMVMDQESLETGSHRQS